MAAARGEAPREPSRRVPGSGKAGTMEAEGFHGIVAWQTNRRRVWTGRAWRDRALAGLALAYVALFVLASVRLETNDDVFVYFNYARNFCDGRPFAL